MHTPPNSRYTVQTLREYEIGLEVHYAVASYTRIHHQLFVHATVHGSGLMVDARMLAVEFWILCFWNVLKVLILRTAPTVCKV